MNKNSLVNKVRVRSSFNKELSSNIFNFVFDEIKRIVLTDRKLSILELGEFEVVHRKMQTVPDVRKQAEILLPPKDKLIYKPSKELIDRLKD
ncbi:MAG: HU family DNA-binding protein [Ignavibacteriae bacterium]|nr:HU family DNA-binding protein [Ignavibacteriota bacterium]